VVQVDRRSARSSTLRRGGEVFGVPPASIPDYLALVGDSADGFPGLQGWGAKSAAAVLHRYGTSRTSGRRRRLGWRERAQRRHPAATLAADRQHALLFKDLATCGVDRSLLDDVDQLRWTGKLMPSPTSAPASTRRPFERATALSRN